MIKIISKIPYVQIPVRWSLATVNAFIYPMFIRKRFKYLGSLKNKHKGKRCFIVATGPSLRASDLEMIKDEICLSCNSIVKMFEKTSWRPEYYFMFDKDVFYKVEKDIVKNAGDISNFFHPYDWPFNLSNSRPYILKRDSWYSESEKHFLRNLGISKIRFSENIQNVIYRGGSVVHIMMQFAAFMGFSEIYLLGCDCNYGGSTMHAEGTGYTLSNQSSNERIMSELMEDYILDKNVIERMGVKIFNVTRGGKLELFERKELENLV